MTEPRPSSSRALIRALRALYQLHRANQKARKRALKAERDQLMLGCIHNCGFKTTSAPAAVDHILRGCED